MDYFLEIIEHDNEFYIHHSKLIEYGIMTSTESSKIKDKLNQYGLVKDIDFTLADILERGKSGAQIHKHYHLTPYAFKICLMRSRRYKNQPVDPTIYCTYYLLLEKVYKYYTDYERLYANKLLSFKDDKIDLLEQKIDEQSKKMDDQSKEIHKLLGYAKETNDKLEETNDKLEETNDKLEELRDVVRERNEDVAIPPNDNTKLDSFALYKVEENRYKIICGQSKYIKRNLRNVQDRHVLINSTYNPNPKTMFVRVKDMICENDNPWINIRYKTLIIENSSYEDQLIDLVNKCNIERSHLEIP